jgi:hypothetical protein
MVNPSGTTNRTLQTPYSVGIRHQNGNNRLFSTRKCLGIARMLQGTSFESSERLLTCGRCSWQAVGHSICTR